MFRSLIARTMATTAALTCCLAVSAQACSHNPPTSSPPHGGTNVPPTCHMHFHRGYGHDQCGSPSSGGGSTSNGGGTTSSGGSAPAGGGASGGD